MPVVWRRATAVTATAPAGVAVPPAGPVGTDLPGGICSRCDGWARYLVPAYWPAESPRPLLCPACCLHLAAPAAGLFDRASWPDTTHLGSWADPPCTEDPR